jgi:GTPase SAR1 family protein
MVTKFATEGATELCFSLLVETKEHKTLIRALKTLARAKAVGFLKIILIGDQNVGKSTLIGQLVNKKFNSTKRLTLGADFQVLENVSLNDLKLPDGTDFVTLVPEVEGKRLTLQIWDIPGDMSLSVYCASSGRPAHACMLCYDVNDDTTVTSLGRWKASSRMIIIGSS